MKTIFVRPLKIRIFLEKRGFFSKWETLILGKVLKVGVQNISGKMFFLNIAVKYTSLH